MFKEIESVPDFPKMEKATTKYWKKINAVEKLKEIRADAKKRVYYDGPITANNMPHYGHAVQWMIKDLVPRYWSMQGFFVSRNMGWDCQGIPVEYEVEKQLGFEKKEDIEEYGVAKFNELCRQSVFKYRDSIFKYETLVGRWFDESDMYYTMDADFIESMWWSFKELYKKGLLYEGHKVVAYSTRAGTTLSTHEVNAGGYAEVEDPYITVKFPLKNEENTYILAWTTTPWTIPGNLLLAVGEEISYVKVDLNGENLILAKDLLKEVLKDSKYKIIEKLKGSDLAGKEYIPPFDYFEHKRKEGLFKVIIADHATTEEGTGIVHLAPYGAEDFEIFMGMGIELFDYLDETAKFTDLIPKYAGKFYKDANDEIIADLKGVNRLFSHGTLVHRMPMCWRTDTPLIYKPIKSWYLAVTKIKDRMIEENAGVNWVPDHVGTGRAGNWIENARDWALSRKRYWGTPLPVWINDKTGEKVVIGSFAELKKLSGQELKDPHRPYVDEITWKDKKNGGTFKRVTDVVDVWYDSGAMPFAQLHYPFENNETFGQKMPAEFVCEMYEQARLWFYTMLVLGVALFDKVPYKNVVAHGVMLDKKGKKLSKSKKNFPPMDDVFNTVGADILRLFILTSPIVVAESARFYKEALVDVRKEFFIPLWNSLNYFVTYANLNNYKPSGKPPEPSHILDKWILARLQETVNTVTQKMDAYLILEATRTFTPFVSDLSTWYIRRSRDRIRAGDKEALNTLYYVLVSFTKIIAPIVPFLAETLYQQLNVKEFSDLDSVHFDLYPETRKLTKEEKVCLNSMKQTRDTVSSALSVRVSERIKIRQPLGSLYTTLDSVYTDLVQDEVNVKEVKIVKSLSKHKGVSSEDALVKLDITLTEELKIEGAARDLVRKFQDLRKKNKLKVSDEITAEYENTEINAKAVKSHGSEIKTKILAKSLKPADAYSIAKKD